MQTLRISPRRLREAGVCAPPVDFITHLLRLAGEKASLPLTTAQLRWLASVYRDAPLLLASPYPDWGEILAGRQETMIPELAGAFQRHPETLLRLGYYAHLLLQHPALLEALQ